MFACAAQGINISFCSVFHYYLPDMAEVLDREDLCPAAEKPRSAQRPHPSHIRSARLQGTCVGSIPVSSQPVVMQTLCERIQEGGEAFQGWAQSQGRW